MEMVGMMAGAIRGATQVEANTGEAILQATEELLKTIIDKNDLLIDDIVCIQFSATEDVDAQYPAVAARKIGITHAALMCFNEMKVPGSLKMCIRAMVLINTSKAQKDLKHVYLRGAKALRPDLADEND